MSRDFPRPLGPGHRGATGSGAWDGPPDTDHHPAATQPWTAQSAPEPYYDDPVPSPHQTEIDITWSGSPWKLVGLSFVNTLLMILTLGIYGFWGRTEVRRRIWSSVRLNGEPLRYTGTGKELMLGFLVVFGVVLFPVLAITVAVIITFGPESMAARVVQFALYVVFFFLVGMAVYRARRYRLSRTNWRGIRGTMIGSSLRYALIAFATVILYPLTIGWIAPWRANMLQRRLTRETVFGNQQLGYDGTSGPLYARYAVVWIGTIAILAGAGFAIFGMLGPKLLSLAEAAASGAPPVQLTAREIASVLGILFGAFCLWSIVSAWYRASMANHFARSTTYQAARFSLAIGPGGLIWLFLSNLFLIVFTLGILRPVAEARMARYLVERMRLNGPVDLAEIAQSEAALGRTGEGLAQAFDVDAF